MEVKVRINTFLLIFILFFSGVTMAKKEVKIPDYANTLRKNVPDIYKWKVEDLYKSEEEWKKDLENAKQMLDKIDELYKGWTESAENMYKLLNLLTKIDMKLTKAYTYPSLISDTELSNSHYQAMKGQVRSLYVEYSSKTSFIKPDILKLGEKKINEYLRQKPELKDYSMMFDSILRVKDHVLDTDKENILAQTGLFAGLSGKAASILNNVDIPSPEIKLSDGKKVKLNYSTYVRYRGSSNRKDRVKVMRRFWKNHAKFRNTHSVLLDTEIKSHLFYAKVRKYKDCLEAALYPQNIDRKVYTNLIKTVKENLGPLHNYLKLKAEMLNLKDIKYDDIYASAVPSVDKKFTLKEAEKIIINAMKPLGKDYTEVLKKAFNNRWMDAYPNKDKRSGAYSQGSVYDVHPYVLLNYDGTYNSVSTIAHEFGHSLHSYFSNKTQPYPKADYPIFLAEIASTFNETLLIKYMLKHEKDDLFKLYLLDQYLENLRATLYRQTLFADFELQMHQEVEKGNTLTADWLDKKYLELTRLYYGHKKGIMKVDKYIENEWSEIPHFYYDFYVYQYSTGIIASTALADMVLNGGKKERERYLEFLKTGGSKYPLETLKKAGVDLTTKEPILKTLKMFNDLVEEMRKIYHKLKKNGKI